MLTCRRDTDSRLLGEYDANGAPLHEVIYLRGTPVGVMTPTGLYYVYADHIDTPRVIARNSDHAIVWRWDEAEAFGATPPNEDPNGFGTFTFNMRFPGQVYDRETGLFYNVNRDYRPADGRYVQADPVGFDGGYLTLYTYVGGNPLSYTDLEGLAPNQTCVAAATAIGSVCGGVAGRYGGGVAGGVAGGAVCTMVMPGVGTAACGTAGAIAGSRAGAIGGSAVGAAIGNAVGNAVCSSSEDREKECQDQLERDEAECLVAKAGYGRRIQAVCLARAKERYAQCLRGE